MYKAGSMLIILSFVYIQACSTRQVYDAIQYNERLKCKDAPYSEQDECMERTNESYDKYKEKRKEVIDK